MRDFVLIDLSEVPRRELGWASGTALGVFSASSPPDAQERAKKLVEAGGIDPVPSRFVAISVASYRLEKGSVPSRRLDP